jgi:ubiquinone/menaquinone biosynthesis C-methylase UbiE
MSICFKYLNGESMPNKSFSKRQASDYYDFLGERYDWISSLSSKAHRHAVSKLELIPAINVLNVGIGTGAGHEEIQNLITPSGVAFGLDISRNMLIITRNKLGCPLLLADGGQQPFRDKQFDRLYCAYTLDLLPAHELSVWLQEFRRVLKPDGRMVLVYMSEGKNILSRVGMSIWQMLYSISPLICGGCRPLNLISLVQQVGFAEVDCETISEFGFPSAILTAM